MLTFIIRYPNDTLQLATQDHLKGALIVNCEECGAVKVVGVGQDGHCGKCGHKLKVTESKVVYCRQPGCSGEVQMVTMATGNVAN